MHKLFVAVFALAVLACSTGRCFAALGETEAEVEKRFGKPVQAIMKPADAEPAEKQLVYELVRVNLVDGCSVSEVYHFAKDNGVGFPVKDHLKAAEGLMGASANGEKWISQAADDSEFVLFWYRSDEKAIAFVHKDTPDKLEVWDLKFRLKHNLTKAK